MKGAVAGPAHPDLAAEYERVQKFLDRVEARAKEGEEDRAAAAKETADLAAAQAKAEALLEKEYEGKETAPREKDLAAIQAKIAEIEANRDALLKRIKFSDMVKPLDEPELLAHAKKILADPKRGLKSWEDELAPNVPRTVEIVRMAVICEKLTQTKAEWHNDVLYPIDFDYFKVSTAEKCTDGNYWIRTYAFWYIRRYFEGCPREVWFLKERDDGWSRILPENIEK